VTRSFLRCPLCARPVTFVGPFRLPHTCLPVKAGGGVPPLGPIVVGVASPWAGGEGGGS
jgi:hypothetical protein